MKEQYSILTKKIIPNVSTLNAAFFKGPGWLDIHPGFIIENQLKTHPCKYKYDKKCACTTPSLRNWKCQPTIAYEIHINNNSKWTKTEPLIFEDFTIHHLSEYPIEATPNRVHLIPLLQIHIPWSWSNFEFIRMLLIIWIPVLQYFIKHFKCQQAFFSPHPWRQLLGLVLVLFVLTFGFQIVQVWLT